MLLTGLTCLTQAQPTLNFPPGVFQNRSALDAGAVAFQGPGDIAPSAKAFWATSSCYTAAYSGSVALIADVATGLTTTTTGCTAGVVSVISGSPLATTCAVSCKYIKLFDQSAALSCAGSTVCDVVDPGSGTNPVLTANSLNTTSCAQLNSNMFLSTAANFTLSQPFTGWAIWKLTGGATNLYGVIISGAGTTAGTIRMGSSGTINKAGMYNGANIVAGAPATDNAYHANAYVMANATQSVIYVDGTGTNQSLGAATGFGAAVLSVGSTNTGSTGFGCEFGIWGSDLGSTVSASLSTNARTRYGSF